MSFTEIITFDEIIGWPDNETKLNKILEITIAAWPQFVYIYSYPLIIGFTLRPCNHHTSVHKSHKLKDTFYPSLKFSIRILRHHFLVY